jgi:hypothetical protein
VAILCRLYGEEKSTHFQIDWLPLARIIIKTGHIFNWADILAFNIFLHAKNLPGMKKPCFYMSSYMIDAIFSSIQFPELGWNWNRSQPLVHVYLSQLWSVNFKQFF